MPFSLRLLSGREKILQSLTKKKKQPQKTVHVAKMPSALKCSKHLFLLIKMQIWRAVVSTYNSQCLTRWIITAGIKLSLNSCWQQSLHQCLIQMEEWNSTEWNIMLSLQMGVVFITTSNTEASRCQAIFPYLSNLVGREEREREEEGERGIVLKLWT